MKLVVGPNYKTARRFARELGDQWDGVAFDKLQGYNADIVVLIEPLKIDVLTPMSLRQYIWNQLKPIMTAGNERNIYVL